MKSEAEKDRYLGDFFNRLRRIPQVVGLHGLFRFDVKGLGTWYADFRDAKAGVLGRSAESDPDLRISTDAECLINYLSIKVKHDSYLIVTEGIDGLSPTDRSDRVKVAAAGRFQATGKLELGHTFGKLIMQLNTADA